MDFMHVSTMIDQPELTVHASNANIKITLSGLTITEQDMLNIALSMLPIMLPIITLCPDWAVVSGPK